MRSYEQAEQVYKAMVLRGYGAGQIAGSQVAIQTGDWVLCIGVVLVAVGLVVTQWVL